MSDIRITFPDGYERSFESGITAGEIASGISSRLGKEALAAKYNGVVVELWRPLESDGTLEILRFNDPDGAEVFRHSTAHLMAQALKRKYPKIKLGIGPPIENGFYYDVDLDESISPEDFAAIEAEMAKIVDEDHEITREELSRDAALKFFADENEDFKIELINDLPDDATLSTYSQGEFTDLCRGPHVTSTKKLGKNFKLLSVAGSYWRGDENNKMLQRIYATSFPKKSQLEEHLHRLEEAKRRDHRKLGKELDLFSVQDSIGSGLILWHPKGSRIRRVMEDYWVAEHYKHGYEIVHTPHAAKLDLWNTSGHTGFYRENMFSTMELDNADYQLKPMNCPFHLMRVRGFTQDDAHIFCTPEQLTDELVNVLDLVIEILSTFGFAEYDVYLSTRPEKYVGSIESWDLATESLKVALEKRELDYTVDPGEGVFYGPKIDIKIRDTLGRSWQCSTIQVDFNLPERFEMEYVGDDGETHRPIMVHRALMGSLERFFGILIEHYGGSFPTWLAPVQVAVLPITDKHHEYANTVEQALRKAGVRVDIDRRNEKIGFKIREKEVQKVPYMLIIGDREIENQQLSVRHHGEGDLGAFSLDDFLARVQDETENKK